MKEPIPTESRIFADRYCRELRAAERRLIGQLVPGAEDWGDALETVLARMDGLSPGKAAASVRKLSATINEPARTHLMMTHYGASRSATLIFTSFNTGRNPLRGLDNEQGVHARMHMIRTNRHGGGGTQSGRQLAYMPWHALARMHQRGSVSSEQVDSTLLAIAGLGYVTRHSPRHIGGGMSLDLGDLLLVGTVRGTVQDSNDGTRAAAGMLDIRTALAIEDVTDARVREQGLAAREAAIAWLKALDADGSVHAEKIPVIAGRDDDFTAHHAVRVERKFCTGR